MPSLSFTSVSGGFLHFPEFPVALHLKKALLASPEVGHLSCSLLKLSCDAHSDSGCCLSAAVSYQTMEPRYRQKSQKSRFHHAPIRSQTCSVSVLRSGSVSVSVCVCGHRFLGLLQIDFCHNSLKCWMLKNAQFYNLCSVILMFTVDTDIRLQQLCLK